MNDHTVTLTQAERVRTATNLRPVDAATMLILDHSGRQPRVLMGKRHPSHKFMPGKYVFPGGRIDPEDRRMTAAGALPGPCEQRLAARCVTAMPPDMRRTGPRAWPLSASPAATGSG